MGNVEARQAQGHDDLLGVAVIMVGNAGVGKTSIMNRYVNSSFEEDFEEEDRGDGDLRATPKMVELGGKQVELSFVDGSGLHEVKDQTIENLRNYPRAIVMVYDVTCMRSFVSLSTWLRKIEANHGGEFTYDSCLVVGNKADMTERRQVPRDAVRHWIEQRRIRHHVEMSAKEDTNVKVAIESLVVRVLKSHGVNFNFFGNSLIRFSGRRSGSRNRSSGVSSGNGSGVNNSTVGVGNGAGSGSGVSNGGGSGVSNGGGSGVSNGDGSGDGGNGASGGASNGAGSGINNGAEFGADGLRRRRIGNVNGNDNGDARDNGSGGSGIVNGGGNGVNGGDGDVNGHCVDNVNGTDSGNVNGGEADGDPGVNGACPDIVKSSNGDHDGNGDGPDNDSSSGPDIVNGDGEGPDNVNGEGDGNSYRGVGDCGASNDGDDGRVRRKRCCWW